MRKRRERRCGGVKRKKVGRMREKILYSRILRLMWQDSL
jgi:hypothetical protein